MNIILYKFLLGDKVKFVEPLVLEGETIEPKTGIIIGMNLKDNDLTKGIEYSALFGDWLITGIAETHLEKQKSEVR